MIVIIRWIRLLISCCLLLLFVFCAINYKVSVYLCYQAKGQLHVLFNKQTLSEFEKENVLSQVEKENISLVEKIKKYSVDSLAYKVTNNFTEVYNQKNAPILWVITASEPYALKAYEWTFPVVGKVSYKGFFIKELAEKEYNRLKSAGYDADLETVSAWSTLGWFKDPLLSSMLKKSKGGLCNLLFHELFHATYYAPNSVDFNENIASFIAHNATIQFLKTDTASLSEYLSNYNSNLNYNKFMLRQNVYLKKLYQKIKRDPSRLLLKLKAISTIADSLENLPGNNAARTKARQSEILNSQNACFIDFEQYDSKQDSLEKVFNKIYKGNLKKLVQDLKRNQINY
jgi:predicted aminopeptidase